MSTPAETLLKPCTAFEGARRLLSGPLAEVALAVKAAVENGSTDPLLVFDDANGRVVDLDLRGSDAEVIERLARPPQAYPGRYAALAQPAKAEAAEEDDAPTAPRGRGRPKLGVVSREVTLLPRQWEWLAEQPGGASATLRRLIDEGRKKAGDPRSRRMARDAAYQFMTVLAGDLPGYEEALRALFADDGEQLARHMASWPADIREHAWRLAFEA
ncbi:DUF2239 family protein [Chromobacterium alticapitis]|uniref:DUF2239 domain-containing protein n=1 Tax=Chromobacterium alticapitis TaxID=2073169 RepID=A0A2S5DLA9_9NEIS|nr:DUF2239 family protein [Chromobacterium alticapitis]POZ63845.1 DUF2239 domain-containing protein [Chromobacterium alticapitis]